MAATTTTATATTDSFNPVGFDWTKGAQNIGGTIYAPQMSPVNRTDEAGNTVYTETGVPVLLTEGSDESLQYVMRPTGYSKHNEADYRPGGVYEVYDLSGKLLERKNFTKYHFSGGFFDDLFDTATGLVKEVAPLAAFALGAGPLGQMLGAAAANTLGITGLTAAQTAALGSAIGNASITALSGGDIEDALRGAVTGGVSAFALPYIGEFASSVGEVLGGGPLGDIAGRAVSGAGSSALNALVRGQDLEDALLSGLVGGGAGGVSSALTGLVDLPAPIERIIERGLTSGMLGQDTEAALVNALIGEARRGITQGGQQGTTGTTQPPLTGGATPVAGSGGFDWESLYNTPSELPGYVDPDGFYVLPTDITPADPSAFPTQDFGTTPQSDISQVYGNIVGDRGGFASTWQTVGSDRILVQDDGSAIGLNTETGETYALTPEETTQMANLGLLNTAASGYQEAVRGTGAVPRGTAPTRGTAPARPTSAGSGQNSDDLMALLAMLTAMGGREEAPEQYQLANVAPGVQAGLRAVEEMYGTNRG